MPLQEGGPEVLERGEGQRDDQRLLPDVEQALGPPEFGEIAPAADGHVALVPWLTRRVQRHRLVPEYPQHSHAVPVVPHRGGHHPARPGHAGHLPHRGGPVWDEVDDEQGEGRIERPNREPEQLRVALLEHDSVAARPGLGIGDVGRGRVDAHHPARRCHFQDGERQGPGS